MPAPLENNCERTLARLDGWDELSPREAALVEEHARVCAACADQLAAARAMAASFRRQGRLACPPEIRAEALAMATRDWSRREREERERSHARRSGERASWMGWLRIAWQPALAASLLALIALLPSALSHPDSVPGASPPSAAEIARAEKDLKLALAYFGHVTETAESTLRREMVDNVIAPTRRAWGLDGLEGGERR